jgi:hypothetical protein
VDGHRTASNLLYDLQHEEQAQRQVQTRKAQRRENDVAGVDLGRAAPIMIESLTTKAGRSSSGKPCSRLPNHRFSSVVFDLQVWHMFCVFNGDL